MHCLSTMSSSKDDVYVSTLDETSKKRAKEELNERNHKDRDLAVQTLRNWLIEQQDWLRSPTDYAFLLRFLRVRKFSQLEARKSIEKYWALKSESPSLFMSIDPEADYIQEMLRLGIVLSPKKLDKDGCRIVLGRPGRLPISKARDVWGQTKIYRVILMAYEWMCLDENTQVNGFKCIWEYTDFSLSGMVLMTGSENNKLVMKFQDKCMPARVKGLYLYNEPPFIEMILNFFTPFMSKKMKDRMKVLGKNLSELYDYVGKDVLPNEYLPDDYTGPSAGPEQEILDDMISDLMAPKFRDYLKDLTSSKYGVDFGKRPKEQDEVASFRKLNVD